MTSFAEYFSFAETAAVCHLCCEGFRDLEIVGECQDQVGYNQDGDGGRGQDEQSHLSLVQRLYNLKFCVHSRKITQQRMSSQTSPRKGNGLICDLVLKIFCSLIIFSQFYFLINSNQHV